MGDQQSRPAFAGAGDGRGVVEGVSGATAGNAVNVSVLPQQPSVAVASGGAARCDAGAVGAIAPSPQEPIPTESEVLARLVTVLGQSPTRSISFHQLRELVPPSLRHLVGDSNNIKRWLSIFHGLLEVTGPPGNEEVLLIVGKPIAPRQADVHESQGEPTRDFVPTKVDSAAGTGGTSEIDDPLDDDSMNPCSVQLRGLPFRATVQDIKAFLGRHAQNLSPTDQAVRLLMNRDGRPSGFAKVLFKTPEAAKHCRETMHKHLMGERYVEVLACTERSAPKAKTRRVPDAPVAESAGAAGFVESCAELTDVLQECRDHMRMAGQGADNSFVYTDAGRQCLLSMLGIALSPGARAYLRRVNLGLKHFLARFPNEFRIDGPKGCERVTWLDASVFPEYDYGAYGPGALGVAAALQAGATPDQAVAVAMAGGASLEVASAMVSAALATRQTQAQAAWPFAAASAFSMYATPCQAQESAAAALEAATANAAATAASAHAAASKELATITLQDPSTPKLSPTPHKIGHCMATPSDWGTPGLGGSHRHQVNEKNSGAESASGAAAAPSQALATNGASNISGPPTMPNWSPYSCWPPPWTGVGAGAWPSPWSDLGLVVPKAETGTVGGKQPAGQGKRGSTAAAPKVPGSSATSGEPAQPSSRSHAHLHPQTHPLLHLQRGAGNATGAGSTAGGGASASGTVATSAAAGEAAADSACLRLRGLPFSMTVQDVLAFFAQHDVADLISESPGATQLLPKANGRPSGQAVVQMRNRVDAEIAQRALTNQWIGGRYIEVFVYGGEEDGETGTSAPQACPPPNPPPPEPRNTAPFVAPTLPQLSGHNPWAAAMPWQLTQLPPPMVPVAGVGLGPTGREAEAPTEVDPWSALFNFLVHPDSTGSSNATALPKAVEGAVRAPLQV